jgi:hypothetical protein
MGLTNRQFEEAEKTLRSWGISPTLCPLCGRNPSAPWLDPPADDHDCDAEHNRVFYRAAAGIAPLHWGFDWGCAERTPITEAVDAYLQDFDRLVKAGLGLTFVANNFGSGKTTALARILMDGLDRGRSACLVSFQSVVNSYKREDAEEFESRLRSVKLLALDEVVAPKSEAQATLFERVADVINARYEAYRPVFVSGNLSRSELEAHYPKIYSRLTEMTDFVVVPDIDFRPAAGRRRRLAQIG